MSFPEYSAYKESGVEWFGDVPAHWPIDRLKRVATVLPSNVDKQTIEGEQAVLLCNYLDVYRNDRIVGTLDFMRASASPEQVEKLSLRMDDCIITKDSEDPSDIGVPAYVGENISNLVCGYHLSIVRPNAHRLTGRFLFYMLNADYVRATFQVGSNGLTRYGLGRYAIDNLDLAVPPLSEQSAIADFLDRETAKIDALVAEQERLLSLLSEKRQTFISHAVTKGLEPTAPMKDSGVEWLGEVPAHWEIRPLRSTALVVRGASPRPADDPLFFGGDFMPWVTVAEITKDDSPNLTETAGALTEEGAKLSRIFPADTLLYSNSGATLGVPKILRRTACGNDGVVGFLRLIPSVDITFLYYVLASMTDTVRDMIKQGSGQPNLNTDIVKGFRIAQPPLGEQTLIVAHITTQLDRLDLLRAESDAAIALLQERRAALISAAVTGKIDVRHRAATAAEAA